MKPVLGIGCIDSRILRLGVSGNAIAVFTALLAHMDQFGLCYPSIHRLSLVLSMRRNTIAKAIKELEVAGVIEVTRCIRAKSLYQLRSLITWNLAQIRPQIHKKSGSNKAPANAESGSNKAPEVHTALSPVRTTARLNDGKRLEDDFWNYFISIPFNGKPVGDVRLIPNDVRRSSNARQLLHLAWNMNDWYVKSCKAIAEWYSWPWRGSGREERVTSIRKLIYNFQEQADLAQLSIQRRQEQAFEVVQ